MGLLDDLKKNITGNNNNQNNPNNPSNQNNKAVENQNESTISNKPIETDTPQTQQNNIIQETNTNQQNNIPQQNITQQQDNESQKSIDSQPTQLSEEISTDLPSSIDELKKENLKETDQKKGLLREENIFSFKDQNIAKKEKEIYDRIQNTYELPEDIQGKKVENKSQEQKVTPNLVQPERSSLQELRKITESEREKPVSTVKWKRTSPTTNDPVVGKEIETKLDPEQQTVQFNWKKNIPIEEPKATDFSLTENESSKNLQKDETETFDKMNNTKTENPLENIADSEKNISKDYSEEIKWMKNEEKIEEPNEKDFSQEQTPPKSTSNEKPKWVEKKTKIKEIIDSTDPKEDEQVTWLEGDIERTSLQEDVINEMKQTMGPKWMTNKDSSNTENESQYPKNLSTPIDKMFELLSSYKTANVNELADYSGLPPDAVEVIARKFEETNITEMKYYTTPGKRPGVILKEDIPSNIRDVPKGTVLDNYEMVVDFVPIIVTIIEVKGEPRPIYTLGTPSIGKYTRKFLDIVKDEVAETMPIELEEILDPKKSKKLKIRFFKELTKNILRYLPNVSPDLINPLSGLILHELYGLGDIELFMADDMLEEVAINSAKTPLTVYHRVYGWMKTNVFLDSEERIVNYSAQIGRKVGREITILKPILDAHLLSGDRVNATLFPISSEGNTLTIRRFARRPWTIIDFIGKAHTMTTEMAALLWIAMQYELNILVAGGTASGKTSALNTLLAMVPPYHRVLSIEDVREIVLPKYLLWNWVPMVTRSPNPEGLGEVTMLELMHSSLRMRPDRIIVGEIRRHKEAEVLMEAIETGHSIYSTIHANSAYQVLRRLIEPPMDIPPLQVELVDIIIVQYRDRRTNKRRTYEIAEIEQTSSGQGLQVNTLYKWSPRTDGWDKLSKPVKLLTILNLHTGLTEEDIMKELRDRQMILDWMVKNNVNSLDDIGLVMKIFYSDADKVKKLARKNVTLDEFKSKI